MFPMNDLSKIYKKYQSEYDNTIKEILENSVFLRSKEIKEFENSFANYLGIKHCVSVANGSDALEIAIEALELPQNSEIILPANTFVATAEAVSRSGNKPIFCDCNEDYNISIEHLKQLINEKTSAIILVHMFGKPCNIEEIKKVSRNIILIEDCAHSHGTEYRNKKTGTFGEIAAFSFNPTKNLSAFGDAGAIATNDESLSEKCRMIANHGKDKDGNHQFPGRNSKMDSLQAGILNINLNHLEETLSQRIKNAQIYKKELANNPNIILPKEDQNEKHVFHQFVIRTKKRDELKKYLQKYEISTLIHYPKIIPRQNFYKDNKNYKSEEYSKEILSLPIAEHLTENDIKYIASKINNFN